MYKVRERERERERGDEEEEGKKNNLINNNLKQEILGSNKISVVNVKGKA
jgi:hypothetical protein